MSDLSSKKFTRRQVLRAAGAAGVTLGFPAIVPSSVFGENAPSNRITIGMIGMGRQAMHANTNPFLYSKDCQVVAVCDVDKWRLDNAKKKVDGFYKNSDCRAYTDWRDVIGRDDIDAIMNSTSDQWHVLISLAAVRKGKHVSCEKPLTLSIAEGRVLADAANAAKKNGVVFRTDSECRSDAYMHKTAELAINGYLGNIKRIEVGVPGEIPGGNSEPMEVPEELDYDMWVGPAPMKPYTVDRVHPRKSYGRPGWMRCRDTCEGTITNWGTHLLDVAQQLNGTERTGPVSVEGTGQYPEPGSGLWNVLLDFRVQFRYAKGVVLDYLTDEPYVRVEGDEGWIKAHWFVRLTAHDKSIFRIKFKESDRRLPQRMDKEDFIYAIKNKCNTMADAEVGHRTCSLGQLGHIAIQRGRKLNWDPTAERFIDDNKANKMLHISYRKPWGLTAR